MIAALLLIASLADKPFVLTWVVDWGGERTPTTHTARFETVEDALDMEAKAPLCSAPKEPPCVVWTRLKFVEPSEENRIKEKRK